MSLAQLLERGIAQLGQDVPAAAIAKLTDYVELLRKWNETYNLTAVREPAKMVTHHLLDSLAVLPHVMGTSILDVGSGGGLPGVPLAIARPLLRVTLIDSNHKKAAFLRQAVMELHLDNVTVVCERVERWETARRFDMVVSRALADLPEFVRLAGRLVAAGGVLATMKGVYPHEELAALPAGWRVKEVIALDVPGLHAERHWICVEPTGERA